MYSYKIYNSYLNSDIRLEQLIEAVPDRCNEADIVLKCLPFSDDKIIKLGKNQCSADVSREEIIFRNERGTFLVSGGNYIQVYPNEGEAVEKLHPFILGYCMSMLFWQRGMMAIHCSAVAVGDSVISIAGGSGSGKSTLTNRLLLSGNRLVSDDVAVISLREDNNKLCSYALPAFPQQKLCRDAAIRRYNDLSELKYIDEDKDKFAVSCRDGFCEDVLPVRAIINLCAANVEQPEIAEITGHDKIRLVLDNLFLRPMFEEEDSFSPEDMFSCMKIASSIDAYKLYRPLNGDTTAQQERIIREVLDLQG